MSRKNTICPTKKFITERKQTMKKRIICLLITFAVAVSVCCALSLSVDAAGWETSGNLKFKLNYDGNSYRVAAANTSITTANIPRSFAGKPVTEIADSGFKECHQLRSCSIPDSIKKIGTDAFCFCEKLTDINLPSSVTYVGSSAFLCCESLTSIAIPNGTTHLDSMFSGCENLKTVYIPKTVTSFVWYTFKQCHNLETIYFAGTRAEWNELCKNNFYTFFETGSKTSKGTYTVICSVCPHLSKTTTPYTAPTCSSYGYTSGTYCNDCEQYVSGHTLIDKTNEHRYGSWFVSSKPTETAEGVLSRTCSYNSSHRENFTLPILSAENGYDYTLITSATCGNTGIERYTYTKDNQKINIDLTIPKQDHIYGEWSVSKAPTEAQSGTAVRICENNSSHTERFTLPKLSKTDYSYNVISEATCETDGEAVYIYDKDGQELTFKIVLKALGHKYGAWILTAEPSTTQGGELIRICDNNPEHKEVFALPALGSGYSSHTVSSATCETEGLIRYSYSKNGQTFTFDVVTEALGHKYGDWKVTKTPTAESEGMITKTCSRNYNHKESFVLPKLDEANGYQYLLIKPAGCTTNGSAKFIFEKDGNTFTFDVVIPKGAHKFGPWNVTTAPTANSYGLITRICQIDSSHTETYRLPKLNSNDYKYTVISEAKCETPGIGKYTYTKDEQVLVFDITIPALEHSFGKWENQNPAYHHRICTKCKTDETALHKWNSGTITKAPTETENGVKLFTCSTCLATRTEIIPKIIPSHTHEFPTAWHQNTTQHWHQCNCGERIDVQSHQWGDIRMSNANAGIISASCILCGYQYYGKIKDVNQCLIGGYIYGLNPETTIEALKKALGKDIVVNGAKNGLVGTGTQVVVGGKEYTVIIKGDIDGDGKITATDYIRVRLHILKRIRLDGEKLLAAHASTEIGKNVSAADYIAIRLHILKKKLIAQ